MLRSLNPSPCSWSELLPGFPPIDGTLASKKVLPSGRIDTEAEHSFRQIRAASRSRSFSTPRVRNEVLPGRPTSTASTFAHSACISSERDVLRFVEESGCPVVIRLTVRNFLIRKLSGSLTEDRGNVPLALLFLEANALFDGARKSQLAFDRDAGTRKLEARALLRFRDYRQRPRLPFGEDGQDVRVTPRGDPLGVGLPSSSPRRQHRASDSANTARRQIEQFLDRRYSHG